MKIAFGGEVQIAIKQFNESININNEKKMPEHNTHMPSAKIKQIYLLHYIGLELKTFYETLHQKIQIFSFSKQNSYCQT